MRAAQVPCFGTQSVITVSTIATPPLPNKNQLVMKVEAVSLSPSDYRILTGACDLLKKPSSFPYVPGGDVSGIVHLTHESEMDFQPGDRVFATWDSLGFGGLAEYYLVDRQYVYKIPEGVGFLEAAGMADSPVNALLAVEDAQIGQGDRVLVLGGSGAVGTGVLQLARRKGASYIATTTTDETLAKHLGADKVIDYTKDKWYEVDLGGKMDVIIDMAEGRTAWENCPKVLKGRSEGGRFVAGVVNDWHIEIRRISDFVSWGWGPLSRWLRSLVDWRLPKYTMLFPAPRGNSMERFLEIRKSGFEVVLDPRGPWEFSSEGVTDAFEVMIARKGHGKVVIAVNSSTM